MKRIKIEDSKIIEVSETSTSASEAARILGINYDTYKKHATRLGVFTTNKSGKGTTKNRKIIFNTDDILEGKYPHFQTNKLRIRLINEGIFEHKCSVCKLNEWNGMIIPIELDHINGINNDHRKENLRMICPNCHAQTSTYKGKNIKKK